MTHEVKKCLLSLFFIFIILFGATRAQEKNAKASKFEIEGYLSIIILVY